MSDVIGMEAIVPSGEAGGLTEARRIASLRAELTQVQTELVRLQAELAHLRRAVSARQRLGLVTGVVAERYGLSPDEAWALLVRISQSTNVRLSEVARLVHDDLRGCLAEADRTLAARLNAHGPHGTRPLIDLRRRRTGQGR